MKTLFLILTIALISSSAFAGGKEVKGPPEKTTTHCDEDRSNKGPTADKPATQNEPTPSGNEKK